MRLEGNVKISEIGGFGDGVAGGLEKRDGVRILF